MGKYLDFYKKCMRTGKIPFARRKETDGGLCSLFREAKLFTPTDGDTVEYCVSRWGYWASDDNSFLKEATDFGATRQNIVLFLAAIHGENFNELKYEQ